MTWRQSKIEEDTPFGRVARPFFYGNDDEFRNNRFKLIPKVGIALHCIYYLFYALLVLPCLGFFIFILFVASFLVSSCPVFFFLILSSFHLLRFTFNVSHHYLPSNNTFQFLFYSQIVDGTMMIKMAVKDTPTILGNKLKQHYFKVAICLVVISSNIE